jgi:1-acyl-sn-glycerol-3-phosphate acyltransferase
MQKLLGYLLTLPHLLAFGLVLVIFEPIQRVCFRLGGQKAHKISVDWLNFFVMRSLVFLGSWCRFRWNGVELPTDRPLIVVSNHQSHYDISPFYWYLRKHHVKFVSKIELAKGIPSISYNLRHGGNALIDRKDPRQALPALMEFATYIKDHNYCAVIFPEGTRSRDGHPKSFSIKGFKVMLKKAPNALVVPVTINHSWKLFRYGKFPMPAFVQPTWDLHPPIEPAGRPAEEVLAEVERLIKGAVLPPT